MKQVELSTKVTYFLLQRERSVRVDNSTFKVIQRCCELFFKVLGKLLYPEQRDFNFPVYTVMMW